MSTSLVHHDQLPGLSFFAAKEHERVYAIAFDLDVESLRRAYPNESYPNAYREIREVLDDFGFAWQQGSVYFGGAEVTPVTCVLAAQELRRRFAWFAAAARDVRMLRIEENNDLLPAIAPV